jgi:phage terminase Nu1 subunit (DNA packaging protein)
MMTILTEDVRFRRLQICELQPGINVLTSWKDIAKYFGKGVRTVQRWEKEFGLPVRRPKQSGKSTVLAVLTEINEWIQSQSISEGHAGSSEQDHSELLRHIEALQAEVLVLRSELQMACAKTA